MLYAFIIVLVIAVGLATGLYFQMKASHGQAVEQQKLLNDYQHKVDEQQKLLDDYRALEKNFDNIGEGYEQALLSFEKMEEEAKKAKSVNEALQQRCNSMQAELDTMKDTIQKKGETTRLVVKQMLDAAKASGDVKAMSLIFKLIDMDDIQADLPPIERTDNVLVAKVSDEAVKLSGVDKSQYAKFEYNVAPDAAATMLSTNLQKAVRSLTHLLDNALKFTSEGTITLNVSVDMDKMQIIYAVEDTGTGIDAADTERIFEPYTKLNQFFEGQGVGLTVARNLARRLGGDLVLDTAQHTQVQVPASYLPSRCSLSSIIKKMRHDTPLGASFLISLFSASSTNCLLKDSFLNDPMIKKDFFQNFFLKYTISSALQR